GGAVRAEDRQHARRDPPGGPLGERDRVGLLAPRADELRRRRLDHVVAEVEPRPDGHRVHRQTVLPDEPRGAAWRAVPPQGEGRWMARRPKEDAPEEPPSPRGDPVPHEPPPPAKKSRRRAKR